MIPQAAPARRIGRFRSEIDAAVSAVIGGESYILGAAVASFEAAFASFSGTRHCVGVASGTDAIAIALRALDIEPGSEVIVPALTFAGTAQAVLHCGAVPRFVDVDPVTRCIDPLAAAAAVTARTSAIVPVHLFGHPCDMPAILGIAERHSLAIVEDCAQSHGGTLEGRRLGTFGHAAATSFYPTKNLGGIGDGGAILTDDERVAERCRSLRNYGFEDSRRISQTMGFNSRLDEMQAAILSALLPYLDAGNRERRAIAGRYREALQSHREIGLPPDEPGCVYHQFAITHPDREGLRERLAKAGIGTAVHYTPGLHEHPAFGADTAIDLPVTKRLAETLLSLPIQPEVAATAIEAIIARFADCVPA